MSQQKRAPSGPRLPRFRTLEEEAEFWDTHDFTEFEDEWRPARLRVAKELQHVLELPLPRDVFTRLIETSRTCGLGISALGAQLIAEGLDRLGVEPAPPSSRKQKRG